MLSTFFLAHELISHFGTFTRQTLCVRALLLSICGHTKTQATLLRIRNFFIIRTTCLKYVGQYLIVFKTVRHNIRHEFYLFFRRVASLDVHNKCSHPFFNEQFDLHLTTAQSPNQIEHLPFTCNPLFLLV